MRKLLVCGAIAVLAAATAAVALASSEVTTFTFKQSARAEGESTGISFKTSFGDPDAATGLPSGVLLHCVRVEEGPHLYSEYYGEP